jgi:N-acetylmuramoyl-L-alanine amidase
MKIKKIFVDPGHGGSDPGAVNSHTGRKESELTLAISKAFEARAIAAGYAVALARRGDDYVSLEARVALAEKWGADLFLSFHINAAENPKAQGFEVWTSIGQTAADDIATTIWGELRRVMFDTPARVDYDDGDPDKESNFYVLRNTSMPAVLIEFEFITNDERAAFLADPANQEALARAVLNAVPSLAD